jgi:DNA-binding response OmpR family regulator
LIVEDDEEIGYFLSLAVTQETPYQAILVPDGMQALYATKYIHPSLLIIDYWLPGMNGIELFDRIHSFKELEDTPALIISASLPKKELEHRDLVGIEKPIELDTFLQTVQNLLA